MQNFIPFKFLINNYSEFLFLRRKEIIMYLLVDVEFDVLHGIDGQVVVAKERVETKQTHQTEISKHLVQAALSEQVVLELLKQSLLMLTKL